MGRETGLSQRRRFLFLESFYGGSHRAFADGLVAHSRHRIDLLTLPARFWKWRMRGAALHFIKKAPALAQYDGLITTDLIGWSDFKALAGTGCPPSVVYFHENQLTYPLAPGEEMDYQFGFTDITTALVADMIRFNSHTHCESFFEGLPGFLKMMPEHRPTWIIEAIRSKSGVLYPGCDIPPGDSMPAQRREAVCPLIVWNHRWEFDKNPDLFFQALDAVAERGADFRLALLGENCQTIPEVFMRARKRYGRKILQYGYVASRAAYCDWLKQGAIVVSTAQQENFGISVVEAVRFGCFPLLPERLAYPEVIPAHFHPHVLYKDQDDLIARLLRLIERFDEYQDQRGRLAAAMGRFAWNNVIDAYDEMLEALARMPHGASGTFPFI
jgi:glycosyltransferase involved in cell wall biosynthesis